MYRKNFYSNMKSLKNTVAEKRNRDAAEIWLRVEKLLLDVNYSTYKNAKELVMLTMSGYNDEAIAIKLGISEDTVRWNKKCLSDELYIIFGEDFFELFDNFIVNKPVIEARVLTASISLTNTDGLLKRVLPLDIIMVMSNMYTIDKGDTDFNLSLSDCKSELNFLIRHSKSSIISELELLDESKLRYIVGLLSNSKGNYEDKFKLLGLLGLIGEVSEENDKM